MSSRNAVEAALTIENMGQTFVKIKTKTTLTVSRKAVLIQKIF